MKYIRAISFLIAVGLSACGDNQKTANTERTLDSAESSIDSTHFKAVSADSLKKYSNERFRDVTFGVIPRHEGSSLEHHLNHASTIEDCYYAKSRSTHHLIPLSWSGFAIRSFELRICNPTYDDFLLLFKDRI